MADDLPADYHAKLMRNLDEYKRDALIFACDNCIDGRDRFEKASVPWDCIACDDYDGDDCA